MILRPKDTPENCMFLPSNMKFSYMRELLFSQLWEKTIILVSTRIVFLRRELLLGKSTKNSLNLLQSRISQRKVILVCIVRESLILVCFLGENYIKPRRELSFSLLENDNSRLNIVILPLIRGENHVIRGTITVSFLLSAFDVCSELPSSLSPSWHASWSPVFFVVLHLWVMNYQSLACIESWQHRRGFLNFLHYLARRYVFKCHVSHHRYISTVCFKGHIPRLKIS